MQIIRSYSIQVYNRRQQCLPPMLTLQERRVGVRNPSAGSLPPLAASAADGSGNTAALLPEFQPLRPDRRCRPTPHLPFPGREKRRQGGQARGRYRCAGSGEFDRSRVTSDMRRRSECSLAGRIRLATSPCLGHESPFGPRERRGRHSAEARFPGVPCALTNGVGTCVSEPRTAA